MKRFLITLLLALPFALCSAQKTANVSVEQAVEMIAKTKKLQIVDVRTPAEFKTGHIKGAVNIDFRDAEFEKKIKKQLKRKRPVLLYCRSGRRSLNAMNKMSTLKFKEVYNLEGGVIVWGKTQALEK
jgi:rhodanese-related sulfurtransferase